MWPPEKTRREEIIDRVFDALGATVGDGCLGCAFVAGSLLSVILVVLVALNWKGAP